MTQADQNEIQHIRDMADRIRRNKGLAVKGLDLGPGVIEYVRKWTRNTDTAADCWVIRGAYQREFKA